MVANSASEMAGCTPNVLTVAGCLLLWQLALTVPTVADKYPFFEETYQPGNNLISLKNLIIDQNTSALYVGSVNHLYKLSADLGIEVRIETGPVQDNPDCIAPPVPCDHAKTTTDNINKLLVIDQDRLFVCGSIYQGSCVIRRLSDLLLLGNNSYEEVAANTADGTSVAFIAPGPTGQNVLYVATSYAEWIDKAVPTVSNRVLPVMNTGRNLFEVLEDKENFLKSQIIIPSNNFPTDSEFNINYLYGFSDTKFSYFVAVQPEDAAAIQFVYRTKIVQICQQDIAYFSYIELPLTCKRGETNYNVAQSAYVATIGSAMASGGDFKVGERVLFVTFSVSRVNQIDPTQSSAVCMYPVQTINKALNNRRKECAQGLTRETDIPWLRSTPCPDAGTAQDLVNQIDSEGTEYCHTSDFIRPLGGNTPIEAEAVYTDDSILSAIAVTAHLEETVIFLGDHRGHLKKLRVLSSSEAVPYEEEAIPSGEGGPVVRNGITFSPDKNFIYFMTERKIHKIPVEDCSAHTTCEDCLGVGNGVGDPYCGWCSLQKNCTRRSQSECTGSEDLSNLRWLGKLDQCIAILSVEPPNTPNTRMQELLLTTRGLPRLDSPGNHMYQCKFGDLPVQDAMVDFKMNTSDVRCLTPSSNQLPSNVPGFLRVELSIRATETGLDIVSTDFDFYDCNTFSSCMECVGNEYRCDWCVFQNKCVGNSSSCDANGVITKQEGVPDGELSCPRTVNDGTEILIAADVSTGINVAAANLPEPQPGSEGYKCILEYEDKKEEVPANRVSESSLECQPREYSYSTDVNDLRVVLTVQWGNGFKIDNPDELSVNLYKCYMKRTNCGNCLAGPDKYKCGWCKSENVCRLETGCNDEWLNGDALCPDASITDFSPKSGFVNGGTNLTITGINLGQKVEDIRSVTVAGTDCIIEEIGYRVATQVVCYTQASDVVEGEIVIVVGSGNKTDSENTVTATSEEHFRYVVPKLTSVSPPFGPASGGTNITITGQNLDAGKNVITVVGGPACKLIRRSLNELMCETPSGTVGEKLIQMLFDGESNNSSLVFEYKQDPTIISLNRYKSIRSGGLDITVEGTNLDVIQNPKIQFTINNTKVVLPCDPPKPTTMNCPSPSIRSYTVQEVPKKDYGFILDGVQNFTSLKDVTAVQPFEFFPDPIYFKFKESDNIRELQFDQTNILEIQGENLTLTYMPGDVNVTIGNGVCKDVTLVPTRLTCYPPEEQPGSKTGAKFPEVVVCHGNLNFTVGQLEYVGEDFLVFILIGVGVAIIIIIIIIILCISYRKANANDTIVRQMEAQRDQLELQVAQECKETFAELQTDMTILTGDLEAIPYREYHMYCIRTLFPDQPNHSVLKELAFAGASKTQIEQGLVLFEVLVNNKQFLLTFIRTLEAQKNFTQKDKSNVASLIMVALQGKMDYSTSILKILLKDLIEKHVEKDRARLLMRRNESVAEKMVSNWLSFLLYNFIREKAGEPLFKLFYAIKQQMEKGPVDAITGEARYGLSEVKVIRQQINYTVITINAIGLVKDAEPTQVKVLDYDTISQVKDKILDALYKTLPYSHRPPKEELDLEWREEGKIMHDDDCKTEGEWRRLNMLCNYPELGDGATIALVPKQGFTMSMYSNSKYMPSANSPARSVTTPMLSPDVDINGTKLWHLVKPSDSDYHKDKVHKMMAEIYLPRLLTTKGVLQTFVDELFEMIFSVNHRGNTLPICIKYLFDLLDDQAQHHNIQNQDVVHSWKSNSLPLRFWVNLIKNPNIIFDIYKSETVDACLSIVGQTLMDACSVSDHVLSKDSSASRLLYAKDIPKYKQWVGRYFEDIKAMPAISDQDMSAMLAEHSHSHQYDFHTHTALNELYFFYAITYKKQIIEELEENEFTGLAEKFSKLCEQLNNTL